MKRAEKWLDWAVKGLWGFIAIVLLGKLLYETWENPIVFFIVTFFLVIFWKLWFRELTDEKSRGASKVSKESQFMSSSKMFLRNPGFLIPWVLIFWFWALCCSNILQQELNPYVRCLRQTTVIDCHHLINSTSDVLSIQKESFEKIELRELSQLENHFLDAENEAVVLVHYQKPVDEFVFTLFEEERLHFQSADWHQILLHLNWFDWYSFEQQNSMYDYSQVMLHANSTKPYLRNIGDATKYSPDGVRYSPIGISNAEYLRLPQKEGIDFSIQVLGFVLVILVASSLLFIYLCLSITGINQHYFPFHSISNQVLLLSRKGLAKIFNLFENVALGCMTLLFTGIAAYIWGEEYNMSILILNIGQILCNGFLLYLIVYVLFAPLLDCLAILYTAEFSLKQVFDQFKQRESDLMVPDVMTFVDIQNLRVIAEAPNETALFNLGFSKYTIFQDGLPMLDPKFAAAWSRGKEDTVRDSEWPWCSLPDLEKFSEEKQIRIKKVVQRNQEILLDCLKLEKAGAVIIGEKFTLTDYGHSLLLYPDRFYMNDVPSNVHQALATVLESLTNSQDLSNTFDILNVLLEDFLKRTLTELAPSSIDDPRWTKAYSAYTSQYSEEQFDIVTIWPTSELESQLIELLQSHSKWSDIHEQHRYSLASILGSLLMLYLVLPTEEYKLKGQKFLKRRLHALRKQNNGNLGSLETLKDDWQELVDTMERQLTPSIRRALYASWLNEWRNHFVDKETVGVLGSRILRVLKKLKPTRHILPLLEAVQLQEKLLEANRNLRNTYSHDQASGIQGDPVLKVQDLFQYYSLMKALIYSTSQILKELREADKVS